jgi:hypothetical protein
VTRHFRRGLQSSSQPALGVERTGMLRPTY